MPEGAGLCSQLGLVMWHQVWLVRVRRHYVVTLAQLAVMLLVLCSVWDESVAPFRAGPHKDYFFDSADAIEFWGRPNESWTNGELAFAPDEAFFADLVQKVCDSLKGTWKPVPFKNRSMAVEYAEKTPASGSDLQSRRVAVWFDRPADDRLTYHARIRDARFDRHDDYLRGLLVPGPFDTDRFDEMRLLLPIQYFIESLFIEAIKNSSKRLAQMKVELMRFPYPRLFYGSEDRTLSRVALRFAVGFFVPFCFLVVKLVHEKRTGRKVRSPGTRCTCPLKRPLLNLGALFEFETHI